MIRQLISAVVLLIATSAAVAQTAGTEQTTGNLVYTSVNPAPAGTNIGSTWSGFSVVNSTGGNTTSDNGAVTGYNVNTGTFMFGYNQGTIAYTYAINQALANSGSGIVVQGYNYSWQINNNNFDNRQSGTDTLTARIITFAPNNIDIRRTDTWTYNTKFDWTTFSGIVNYANPGAPSEFGNMRIEFTGRDSGFWAGYYGPQVRNVSLSLNYGVDPCVANPAYSSACPGYNNIVTSPNLVPNPNHWTTNGAAINNTYAINTALGLSGSQVRIHGFDYGYQYNLGSSYTQCTAFNQDGSCSWTMTFNPQVAVNFSVKNSSGTTIHSQNHTHTGNNTGNQSRSYQYRFSTSQDLLNLGAIGFTGSTTGNSTLFGMTSQAVYTNDSCVSDPLISPSCPGYAAAYLTQQCTANPLYDQSCPGYAVAFFTQQCTANALYDTACPGYAAAYLTYQCNISQLYSPSCPGYQQAYFDQQCSLDPLYNNQCPGYADAYYVQQCTANPLYDSGCTGYAQAYFDQQCAADGLYNNQCPNYAEAYALKYVVNTPSTPATDTTQIAVTTATDPVASAAPIVADPIVNQAVTTTATSASPAQAATATVPLVAAPQPVATAAASTEQTKEETKTEAASTESSSSTAATASDSTDKKEQPKTARQALAERRMAAARAKVIEEGKQLANRMGEAATMEAQVAVQNVVVQAMGFTPGFDAYGRVTLPDAQGYQPFEIYPGQRNIDNPAGRRFLTGSDRLHADMVDQQYGGRR
jgi:hypothetical protein